MSRYQFERSSRMERSLSPADLRILWIAGVFFWVSLSVGMYVTIRFLIVGFIGLLRRLFGG